MTAIAKKEDGTKRTTAKQLRALVKSFDWKAYQQELADGLLPIYRDLVQTAGADVATANGVTFDTDDPFLSKHLTTYIGERVTQLTKTTQKDLTRVLRQAFDAGEGLGTADLQELVLSRVRETFDGYEAWRALRIARSESAIAFNHGNTLGASQAGFTHMDVVDGTDDPPCAEANGARWTIDRCLNNPIQHPGCVRSFFPAVEE